MHRWTTVWPRRSLKEPGPVWCGWGPVRSDRHCRLSSSGGSSAFAIRYVGAICLNVSDREDDIALPSVSPPDADDLASLVLTAPLMEGAEYLTEAVLLALWDELVRAFAAAFEISGIGLQRFLNAQNPAWNLVRRVQSGGEPP